MQPKVFNLFLARCLPPAHAGMSAEWTRVAQESLPLLSDSEVSRRPSATGLSPG